MMLHEESGMETSKRRTMREIFKRGRIKEQSKLLTQNGIDNVWRIGNANGDMYILLDLRGVSCPPESLGCSSWRLLSLSRSHCLCHSLQSRIHLLAPCHFPTSSEYPQRSNEVPGNGFESVVRKRDNRRKSIKAHRKRESIKEFFANSSLAMQSTV